MTKMLKATDAVFFLLLLLTAAHSDRTDRESGEISLYLRRITDLYRRVGIRNAIDLARSQVFTGLLSDALNAETKCPREEIVVRDVQLSYLSEVDGNFSAYVLTESLRDSLQYRHVRGAADFSRFRAHVTSSQALDLGLYKSTASRGLKNTSFNNGSKGTYVCKENLQN